MGLSRLKLRELLREARRLGVSPESLRRRGRRTVERVLSFAGVGAPGLAGSLPSSTPPPRSRVPGAPDEPIQTRTMARLLEEQGHYRRALAICEKLRSLEPRDAELRRAVETLRERIVQEAGESESREEDDEDDELVSVAVDASRVLLSWAVSERAIARTREMLDGQGDLVARLVVFAPDHDRLVREETRERRGISAADEWVVDDLPPGTRATGSVGLLHGDRFVSIAHAPPIRTT